MTIDELRAPFGLSRRMIYKLVEQGVLTDPPRGRAARWSHAHREAIRAWRALQHNNVRTREAIAYCREEGITLPEFLQRREASIRSFGLGVA